MLVPLIAAAAAPNFGGILSIPYGIVAVLATVGAALYYWLHLLRKHESTRLMNLLRHAGGMIRTRFGIAVIVLFLGFWILLGFSLLFPVTTASPLVPPPWWVAHQSIENRFGPAGANEEWIWGDLKLEPKSPLKMVLKGLPSGDLVIKFPKASWHVQGHSQKNWEGRVYCAENGVDQGSFRVDFIDRNSASLVVLDSNDSPTLHTWLVPVWPDRLDSAGNAPLHANAADVMRR